MKSLIGEHSISNLKTWIVIFVSSAIIISSVVLTLICSYTADVEHFNTVHSSEIQ